VHKSSIYLPDDLKQALAERAVAAGRSEADLIRQAITRLLATGDAGTRHDQAAPTHPGPVELPRPALIGVGVGPGDPGLVTSRAVAVLDAADRVLVISTDERSIGRAEAVVRAVAPLAEIRRQPFDLSSNGRTSSMRQLVDATLAGVGVGEAVAVAVLGDPSQWTVFPELAATVRARRPSVPIQAVPGVTAWQAAAATYALGLATGTGTLVITADPARARQAMLDGDAVVLHKATTDGETIRALVRETGREHAVVAELTGLPGARSFPATDTPDGPLAYLSALIVPAASTAGPPAVAASR